MDEVKPVVQVPKTVPDARIAVSHDAEDLANGTINLFNSVSYEEKEKNQGRLEL